MSSLHFNRIESLRSLMRRGGWDAVIITGTDPHGSEYPASRWKQVEWISGFTGEAGDVVVTADHAGLWTDPRYFIQAVRELEGSGVALHKMRVPGQVSIPQWLAEKFPEGARVAVDGLCQSYEAISALDSFEIVDVPDMLSTLWSERPDIPMTPIETLSEEEVGKSRGAKLESLRGFLDSKDCTAMLVTSLDEIAWLLNVRGSDIDYNPLVISYLLIGKEKVSWFVRKDSLEDLDPDTLDSFEELEADGVCICGYSDLAAGLSQEQDRYDRIFVDPSTLNYTVGKLVAEIYGEDSIVWGRSPVVLEKSVKNEVEIAGFREAYYEDGIALEKFLFWLEQKVQDGEVDEWEASRKLTSLRAEIPGYRGDSFENISAYGANAALPHYVTPEKGSAKILPHGLYLVDSGGQYIFGTTDITRTVPMGDCTRLEMEDYTLVLKGMIDLSMAVFPYGTSGSQIDALARMPLWKAHRNFGHGTGHGTGFYLCVHEGPQDIRQNHNAQPLLPGMVTSNEPGIYREGLHGIRHENVVLCKEAGENEFGRWLEFETLSLCHIDTAAIIPELLGEQEIEWLNRYNAHVYEKLSPRFYGEMKQWLREKTLPL